MPGPVDGGGLQDRAAAVRVPPPDEYPLVAALLDDFNREFGSPTPGPAVLAARLHEHVGPSFAVLVAGRPVVGLAVVSVRPNLWYPGPVVLLDELYVRPPLRGRGIGSALLLAVLDDARRRGAGAVEIAVDGDDRDTVRFYRRHGFTNVDDGNTEPSYWFAREL